MSEIIDQLYAPLLAEHGFIRDSDNQQYGALGICWKLSPEVGEGTYWTYGQKSCFKKYYDCTITEYIQQRRMSQAEYLLAYTELTVGQVAQTVGYSTSSRFAELFRKSTGLLPLEYRKTAQRK